MSYGISFLHSHSGLERELHFPKHYVLIDAKFKSLFVDGIVKIEPFKYNGILYYKVPIMYFVRMGGVFKNLNT